MGFASEHDLMSNDSNAEAHLPPTAGHARKRDPEFWIAIGALLISALAMLSSLMQVSMQRNQERAMVWPHVSARPAFSAKGFEFTARNKGLGPALVRDVAILVDGKRVAGWIEALDVLVGQDHGYGWDRISANDLQDTVLAANESSRLFAIDWDPRVRRAFPGDARLEVRICYCSFLRECWISRAGVDHEPVLECPPALGGDEAKALRVSPTPLDEAEDRAPAPMGAAAEQATPAPSEGESARALDDTAALRPRAPLAGE
jgi:hypothetical protein